ncbi:DUF5906 domain-containing protein [Moraxella sp. ZJ142]|uniref:DUF5906 domain-containing protein n=1 Tax=Moraxella marmotae TaxID=3344520 RepID=UPI0035D454A1
MQNVDFNDLLVQNGAAAVREQITPAITAALSTPTKPANMLLPADNLKLQDALKRYHRIMVGQNLSNKFYDEQTDQIIGKKDFANAIGGKICNEWLKSSYQVINQEQIARKMTDGHGESLQDLLERYYYIENTKEVWDNAKKIRFNIEGMRYGYPRLFKHWNEDPERLKINPANIWFDPTDNHRPQVAGELYTNSFKGLPLSALDISHEQAKAESKPFLDLLLHLCNGNQEHANWVLNWLAIPLQKLGSKMNTGLIFHGKTQGAGKSLFFVSLMRKIYGEYCKTLGQSQLDNQYNDWADGTLYVTFEEIFAGNDRYQNVQMVKHLITGEEIYINRKFISGYTQANFANCVFLSNDMMPLAIEPDDRRMFVISPKSKCPRHISQAVSDALADPTLTKVRAFLQYLLTKDLGEQNAKDDALMTEYKELLIEISSANWERFVKEWIHGYLPVPFETCPSDELFKLYEQWCIAGNERATSKNKFSGYLQQYPNITKKRTNYKLRNKNERKQATFFVVGEEPTNKTLEVYYSECYYKFFDAYVKHRASLHLEPSISQIVNHPSQNNPPAMSNMPF